MKTARLAINGLGRIGRAFLRQAILDEEIEIIAINDLGDVENLAYLLRYDTAYGRSGLVVAVGTKGKTLSINGKDIQVFSEKNPEKLPWGKLQIDIAVESTGAFETYEKAKAHLSAGAKRVVLTAPSKDSEGGETVLIGVNEDKMKVSKITSNASCTTNAASPLLSILSENPGVEKALLNTVHAYTATQSIVDGPGKGDFRRGRAGAANIVPSSTGAAIATAKAITSLENKFDGIAVRVPVVTGSLVDVTFVASKEVTAEEINSILKEAARSPRWQGIFAVTKEPIVSSDIVGDTHASIADLSMTRVVGGNLVKVLAWYDNEAGYANTLLRHVKLAASNI